MIVFETLTLMNEWLIPTLLALSVIYVISGLDDAILDIVAWGFKLRPKALNPSEMKAMESRPEKNIAIMVPAWDEGEIIDRMLLGNLSRIDYRNYHFFVGVYLR